MNKAISCISVIAFLAVFGSFQAVWACKTCGCSPTVQETEKQACETECEKACCAKPARKACCPSKVKKACGTGCEKPCCQSKVEEEAERSEIDTEGLKKLLASKKELTLLDARSGKWDDGRRIPGAESLSSSASAEDAAKVVPNKDALVVTYCTDTKCPASKKLAARLKDLGYNNVVEYPKGIKGWAAEGGDVIDKE